MNDDTREILAHYQGGDRGELLPILEEIQERLGYLPEDAMLAVADFTRVPESAVYAVATFYADLAQRRPGTNVVHVCRGPACHFKGMRSIQRAFERELGIGLGETRADGSSSMSIGQCDGSCVLAPMVWINGRVCGPIAEQDVPGLLRELRPSEGGA